MIIKMDKRGGDKVISVYWFAILFIVAAGIAYMTIAFYGKPYDVRQIEADALTDKAANCISYAGYINEAVLTGDFRNNFMTECGITFDTEDAYDWKESPQFYLETTVSDFNSKTTLSSFASGDSTLKESCGLKGQSLPVCLERKFYTIDKDNKQYEVKILSIVRKIEKNVQ